MLILILIDVQHSWKAVLSFEKGSNHQNHSSLGFLYLVKNSPPPHTHTHTHKTKPVALNFLLPNFFSFAKLSNISLDEYGFFLSHVNNFF